MAQIPHSCGCDVLLPKYPQFWTKKYCDYLSIKSTLGALMAYGRKLTENDAHSTRRDIFTDTYFRSVHNIMKTYHTSLEAVRSWRSQIKMDKGV